MMKQRFVNLLTAVLLLLGGAAHAVTVHLAGDSTVASYSKNWEPMNGWGQQLPGFAKAGVTIRNHAVSGDSAKFFRDQGRWAKLLAEVKPGDYILIQFGHNDQKKELKTHYAEAATDYTQILQSFLDSARAAGATPVLVTPICRRYYSKNGKIWNSLGDYPEAMRTLAARNKVALVDLNAISEFKFTELGDAATIALFVHVPPGKYKAYPNGAKDNTHLCATGAKVVAEWIVTDLQRQKLPVGDCFIPGKAAIERPVAGNIKIDLDGTAEGVAFAVAECTPPLAFGQPQWLPEAKRAQYGVISSRTALSNGWQRYTFRVMPASSGTIVMKIRGGYTRDNTEWIAYDEFRITGAEMVNPDFELLDKGLFAGFLQSADNVRTGTGRAASGQNYAVAAHDHFFEQPLEVTQGQELSVSFLARFEESGPVRTPKAKENRIAGKPLSYYRFHNDQVKYLPLSDKGIAGERIGRRKPGAVAPVVPELPTPTGSDRSTALAIPFSLLEEDGEDGVRRMSFGLPLPRGAFFDCASLRLTGADGGIRAGFRPIGFWPDQSVKFVQVAFSDRFNAGEEKRYRVQTGIGDAPRSPLSCRESDDALTVNTGRLQATIGKQAFRLLENITVDGKPAAAFAPRGAVLTDADGKTFGTADRAPESVRVERNDGEQLVVAVKGLYAGPDAGYEARFFFFRDSAEVRLELSLSNRNLRHEFTDYGSWQIALPGKWSSLTVDGKPIQRSIRQWSERDGECDGGKTPLKLAGRIQADGATPLKLRLADPAERWPKGIDLTPEHLTLQLLPEQPGASYGRDLPYYLMFPFCEGKYRLKWGMRFTETMTFDFSGESMPGTMPIAVIDRDYLKDCGVFPGVPAAADRRFEPLDARVGEALRAHLALKKFRREYGFLNYGDWFGERGRNWGNNEYDLAHGLFQYFLRSGNRDAWRLAMAAARHQADTDTVHAYPDPYYIGANTQHSIGHSGVSYQPVNPATWSYRFDYSISGENGHTWCDGMIEAGMLGADRRVMDSALLLGEHLVNHTSRDLTGLGSHERSAGWSLKALVALYRATGRPAYLEAGKRLADLAVREHQNGKGGAWPHPLPPDHANNVANAEGNACFLVAILCDALAQYEAESGDPDVRRVLADASGWLRKTWSDSVLGWPYTANADGKAFWPAFSTLNFLIAPPMLEAVSPEKSAEAERIASQVLDLAAFAGVSRIGKELGYTLIYLPELYGAMMRNPEANAYAYDPARSPQALLAGIPSANAFPSGIPAHLDAKGITGDTLGRFRLLPDAGRKTLVLRVTGLSGGRYCAVVTDGNGRLIGSCEGLNGVGTEGSGLSGRESRMTLTLDAETARRGLELVFAGSGKVGFAVEGAPCRISLEKSGSELDSRRE